MGYVLAITAVILWGIVQIPIKLAKARGRVGVMVSMLAGLLASLVIVTVTGRPLLPEISGRDWLFIFIMGVCYFPLATFTYFEAVKLAGITTAAPLTRLTPVLVVLGSLALGTTEPSWNLALAPVLILTGGVLCARGSAQGLHAEAHRRLRAGILYGLAATLMWAAGYLAVDQVTRDVDRLLVTMYGVAFGTTCYWIAMLLLGRLRELRTLSRRDVGLYASQGVMSFALAYWAVFEAIRLLGVSRATIISECWPAAAVLVGIAVFREPTNLQKLLGILLLIGSALLASM